MLGMLTVEFFFGKQLCEPNRYYIVFIRPGALIGTFISQKWKEGFQKINILYIGFCKRLLESAKICIFSPNFQIFSLELFTPCLIATIDINRSKNNNDLAPVSPGALRHHLVAPQKPRRPCGVHCPARA